jgi:hypothetical protein
VTRDQIPAERVSGNIAYQDQGHSNDLNNLIPEYISSLQLSFKCIPALTLPLSPRSQSKYQTYNLRKYKYTTNKTNANQHPNPQIKKQISLIVEQALYPAKIK